MKHILATLAFYSKHGLHDFSKTCRSTKRAIKSLEARGYLTVHWDTYQAKYTGKVWA